jgi:geranylgeranyl diphosphate synthase type I
METFGHELGMGFQILDDILGIWGDAETTGKPANDLRRCKKTLPSLYALSRADEADRAPLRHLFSSVEPAESDAAAALAALDRTGARRHCEQMVARYSATARGQLAVLPESDARAALEALVDQLETRDR